MLKQFQEIISSFDSPISVIGLRGQHCAICTHERYQVFTIGPTTLQLRTSGTLTSAPHSAKISPNGKFLAISFKEGPRLTVIDLVRECEVLTVADTDKYTLEIAYAFQGDTVWVARKRFTLEAFSLTDSNRILLSDSKKGKAFTVTDLYPLNSEYLGLLGFYFSEMKSSSLIVPLKTLHAETSGNFADWALDKPRGYAESLTLSTGGADEVLMFQYTEEDEYEEENEFNGFLVHSLSQGSISQKTAYTDKEIPTGAAMMGNEARFVIGMAGKIAVISARTGKVTQQLQASIYAFDPETGQIAVLLEQNRVVIYTLASL